MRVMPTSQPITAPRQSAGFLYAPSELLGGTKPLKREGAGPPSPGWCRTPQQSYHQRGVSYPTLPPGAPSNGVVSQLAITVPKKSFILVYFRS
jgi:hypothetical protein